MNKKLSSRLAVLQGLLCVMVVFIHSRNTMYSGLADSDKIAIIQYAVNTICQVAVPTFFVISAYLFYWNTDCLESVWIKMKKRLFTLGIPYLIWNTVWTVYAILLFKLGLGTSDYTDMSVIKIVCDILLSANSPLWFVLHLLIFTVLSPFIYAVIQRNVLCIVLIVVSMIVVVCTQMDYYSPTYWIPFYIGGGYTAIHKDVVLKKTGAGITRCGLLMLICVMFTFVIEITFYNWYSIWFFRYISTATILYLWFCSKRTFEIRTLNYSLPIYCLHGRIVSTIKHYTNGMIWFLISPVIAIVLISVFCYVFKKFMPKMYNLAFGGR